MCSAVFKVYLVSYSKLLEFFTENLYFLHILSNIKLSICLAPGYVILIK